MRFRNSKGSRPFPKKVPQARSLPLRKPFYIAALLSALHYMSLIVTIFSLIRCFTQPSDLTSSLFVGSLIFSILTWLVAFFKRRATVCPLCKGTPLFDTGALPNVRAIRFRPFNYGVSATLSIIAFQRFRCMYCAADFDLLKQSSRVVERLRSIKSKTPRNK